ncbi:Uncharacterized protein OS=Singulisphaera acidiphila (strain ATCC BAA-1392 / DSM 18658 / VKM B-2454 / MOB10) GN=Sinac_4887 PE=4 SV=1 [Gemmata massiliana]|uniref:DUF2330 domain-containing protein n=1 Tax=Gemmata massiliana TaxID=1210884 RepID=A0A6P2CXI5_9BACT|nr:hypothetical protein [Gemmata massiliana]VTR92474.1 Uncharacterized protein OS=Singulisphaera acidiphila (strain ATCC BAA-1392 / DSM 18658 / VKM B-2454 / MOB10) GN=Sinac_4887 PE=4 SV=1 [Gemmata massiliana]
MKSFFSLVICLAIVGLCRGQGSAPPCAEIERSALSARTQIKTITVKLMIATRAFRRSPDSPELQISERTLWLDGEHSRGDIVRNSGPYASIRFSDCLNCGKAGWAISANQIPNNATNIVPIEKGKEAEFRNVFDPRILGYCPMIVDTLCDRRVDTIVGSADRDEPIVTQSQSDGADSLLIRWTSHRKVQISVWISPAKGWNVTRIETLSPETPQSTARWKAILQSQLAKVDGTNIWYPRQVVFQQFNGSVPTIEETVDVKEVQINQPIPSEIFTLAGLKLKDNTYIVSPHSDETGVLRKGVVVPIPGLVNSEDLVDHVDSERNPQRRLYLIITAIIFGSIAVAIVVLRRMRRSP